MIAALSSIQSALPAAFFPSFEFNPNVLNFLSNLPTSYGLTALKEWYIASNPLHPALLFCTVMSALVWVVGELTGAFVLYPFFSEPLIVISSLHRFRPVLSSSRTWVMRYLPTVVREAVVDSIRVTGADSETMKHRKRLAGRSTLDLPPDGLYCALCLLSQMVWYW